MSIRVESKWDGHTFDDSGRFGSCGYCGNPDKPVTVVVYGQPMADVITVVDSDGCGCCGECAKPAIWLALVESDWCRPAVYVVPVKAVA